MCVTHFMRTLIVGLAVLHCASQSMVNAQLPQIRLDAVFPAGARQGTTIEMSASTGRDLDEADALAFSHPGIRAVQKVNDAGDPVNGQFIVSVDSAVPAGIHTVRLSGLFGISNPRYFRVDRLTESTEKEPNDSRPNATLLAIPQVCHGRSDRAGDVDHFRFTAGDSRRIVIRTEAAGLGSPMQPIIELFAADGRQLAISRRIRDQEATIVHDVEEGQSYVIRLRDTVFSGGPTFCYRLVIDSRPLIEAILPSVGSTSRDGVFLALGRHLPDGIPTPFQIDRQPVAVKTVQLTLPDATVRNGISFGSEAPEVQSPTATASGQLVAPRVPEFPVTLIDHPIQPEAAAEPVVEIPATVCGIFESQGDEDAFRFHGSQGDVLTIEVVSEQLGVISDPLLTVDQLIPGKDGAEPGYKRIATEDDRKNDPGGRDLSSLSSDPVYRLTVPADGEYRIQVTDRYANARGDARLTWMVDVCRERPDFGLVLFDAIANADPRQNSATGAASIRRGGTYSLDVYAWRSPQCTHAIQLAATNLPEGITCRDSVIPEKQSRGRLIFTARDDAPTGIFNDIEIVGTTTAPSVKPEEDAEEATLSRRARVATLVHDAINGLPRTVRHDVPLTVAVMRDLQPYSIELHLEDQVVSQNQQLLVPVRLTRRNGFTEKVDLAFQGVPGNVDITNGPVAKEQDATTLRLFFKDNAGVATAPIFLAGTGTVPYRRNPWRAERADAAAKTAAEQLQARQSDLQMAQQALKTLQDQRDAAVAEIDTKQLAVSQLEEQNTRLKESLESAVADAQAAANQLQKQQQALNAIEVSTKLDSEAVGLAIVKLNEATQKAQTAAVKANDAAARLAEAMGRAETDRQKLKQLRGQLESLQKTIADASTAVTLSETQLKEAEQFVQAADAAKVAAEEAAKKAAEATKPQNVNVRFLSTLRVLQVRPAIAQLQASVPGNGQLKRGAELQVRVTVTRKNGFQGDLQLQLYPETAAAGLTWQQVRVAGDETTATFSVKAANDAAAGARPHLVLRATGEVEGEVRFSDIPIGITVVE